MGILNITIPYQSSNEISYTIRCLLGEFLGLEFKINEGAVSDVEIRIDDKILIIKNHFFQEDRGANDYQLSDLPAAVIDNFLEIGNKRLPVVTLFGKNEINLDGKRIILHSDIISATFFMLSRWEEYVNPARDTHARFPATDSVAFKYGFLDRPIVNEYVEILWALLKEIGLEQKRIERSYHLVPTHDVDRPFLFTSLFQNIKLFGGFVKRGDWAELVSFCKHAIAGTDPWNTHDLFMDLSEKANVKSYFFFLPKGEDKHDGRYDLNDPKVKKLYDRIRKRGHHIGFHPSYNSYNNIELLKKEKRKLEEAVGQEMKFGRQHYLRFETPRTWQMWDECNMEWDSTMSYADCSGFRCGVCYPFPVYDIKNRKQLNLMERPLIVMEGSLLGYEKLSLNKSMEKIDKLKSQVKKYKGEFVFLYHNSSFFEGNYRTIGNSLLNHFYQ